MAKPKEYYESPEKCGYKKVKLPLDPFDRERNPAGSAQYRDNSGGREVDWAVEDRKNAKKPRNSESR